MHPQHLNKSCKIHNTNNAWQNQFSAALSVVMQYTNQSHLKAETIVSDLPERQSQVWEITQGLSSVVHREAKERYYILIWIHKAWIKVLLLAFCLFDIGTSEDQLSFKGVSCETSHFGICCSQIQRCSFCLLKSWGVH